MWEAPKGLTSRGPDRLQGPHAHRHRKPVVPRCCGVVCIGFLEKGAESGVKSALLTQTVFPWDNCSCFVGEVGVLAAAGCRPEPSSSLQPLPPPCLLAAPRQKTATLSFLPGGSGARTAELLPASWPNCGTRSGVLAGSSPSVSHATDPKKPAASITQFSV